MDENINNTQKGNYNTQIGQQNNTKNIDNSSVVNLQQTNIDNSNDIHIDSRPVVYIGMSPEKASEMAIDLFWNNFPKLQEQAMGKVESLIKEFCDTTIKKLIDEKIKDYSPFSTPDMQYVLVEAQTNYARFGNQDLLAIMSDLIVQRVKSDKDEYFKIVLDKAISIIPNLTKRQIDTLTLLFYYKKVYFRNISNLNDLQKHFAQSDKLFTPCGMEGYSLLNSLGCLDLDLNDVCERTSAIYSLKKEDIETICPTNIKNLHCDYSPSHVGIIIAIINSNIKTNHKFNPSVWIHE